MLVGAGGNAGNQSAVRIIRGIAVGTVTYRNEAKWLKRELKMALVISFTLTAVGFGRVMLFAPQTASAESLGAPVGSSSRSFVGRDTVAITASLFVITFLRSGLAVTSNGVLPRSELFL